MNLFNYFNNKNYSIFVTDETLIKTPHTFQKNNTLWEDESIKKFFDCVPKDRNINIVDIGAQSGLYTLFAKYLPLSTFYSFEPFIETFNLLNENIKINNINNVKTFNIGISNYIGDTKLRTSKSHNGLHTLGNPLRFNDINEINIKVDTLDNFFYENDIHVDFIKIDTEGWEYFILLGGIKTIQKYKPLIQIEWNSINMKQCNVQEELLEKLILDTGYEKIDFTGEELLIKFKDLK